jgi:hypothetical protein
MPRPGRSRFIGDRVLASTYGPLPAAAGSPMNRLLLWGRGNSAIPRCWLSPMNRLLHVLMEKKLPFFPATRYIRRVIYVECPSKAPTHSEMRCTECASSSQARMPGRVPTGHGAEALLTQFVVYSILFCLGRPITRSACTFRVIPGGFTVPGWPVAAPVVR